MAALEKIGAGFLADTAIDGDQGDRHVIALREGGFVVRHLNLRVKALS